MTETFLSVKIHDINIDTFFLVQIATKVLVTSASHKQRCYLQKTTKVTMFAYGQTGAGKSGSCP